MESPDRKRSTQPASDARRDGLAWLELGPDGPPVFQAAQAARHAEVAHAMLESGHAYKCYATSEELAELRAAAQAEGRRFQYDGRWRDRDPSEAPEGVPPAIRLKAPREGETVIEDLVQGRVAVANAELDDMVLLRADGTPTYMLAVVGAAHDMGVTHVIRGADHLNNAFRQAQVFHAMGWPLPAFAHIPLIHGADGAKLSKRHGALGVDAYREMGFLPAAVRNYLLRLGWSHGDQEIFETEEAVKLFDLAAVNRAPSRFDMTKLEHMNGQYLREAAPETLLPETEKRLADRIGRALAPHERTRIAAGIASLQTRARTLVELAESAEIYLDGGRKEIAPKAAKLLADETAADALARAQTAMTAIPADNWTSDSIENALREAATAADLKLGKLAQPLRAALTGSDASPSLFEVASVLGREESMARVQRALG